MLKVTLSIDSRDSLPTPDLRIAVTGASGWVGQSILAYLHRKLGPDRFYTCVFPFSSVSRRLNLNFSIDPIQSYPLAEMPAMAEEAPFDFVFHAAFVVRDHLGSSDLDDYILANRMITSTVVSAIRSSPGVRVVDISSGAAQIASTCAINEQAVRQDPYGHLKLEEEMLLGEAADSLVLRIYGLTGKYIRNSRHFAVGSFLHQALDRQTIKINSPARVVRGYVHAEDVVHLAFSWLCSSDLPPPDPVPAVSHSLDLYSLACLISRLYGLPSPQWEYDPESVPNIYTAETESFCSLLDKYGKSPLPLEEQILDTALGIQSVDARL
jgi:nucleoside-diphosphate-sugar epimerase